MSEQTVDHRRAIAERNAASILDAAERLLDRNAPLTMSAIAAEAGVSRPTLYAHYKTIGEIVEAAVERSVVLSMAAFEQARPGEGPAPEALDRMLEASWGQFAKFEGLTRYARQYMSPGSLHRTHEAMMAPLHELIERGRREGAFRTDVPVDWLATMYISLAHGALEHAQAHGMKRNEGLGLLKRTAGDVFGAR
jgi:TetR/AcrR family transcriptional regulator, mexCD-oprJ operon repressor